jgi:hypothetical protein
VIHLLAPPDTDWQSTAEGLQSFLTYGSMADLLWLATVQPNGRLTWGKSHEETARTMDGQVHLLLYCVAAQLDGTKTMTLRQKHREQNHFV